MHSRAMSPVLATALHAAFVLHVYSAFGLWILDQPWISLLIVPPLIALRPAWTGIAAAALTADWLLGRILVPGGALYGDATYAIACAVLPLVMLAGLYSGRLIAPGLGERFRGMLRVTCWCAGFVALLLSVSRQMPLLAMLSLCAANWLGVIAIPGRRAARAWATAALALTSIFVSVAFLETGARLFIARVKPELRLYIPHPKAIIDLRPSFTREVSFRATASTIGSFPITISWQQIREMTYGPKAPDEFRIVLIGDSFTFGQTVPFFQTIGQQLERLFAAEHWPKRVTVINMGVPGTGPWQQQIYLNERGFGFEPDLVIQQLFLGNDLHDTLAREGRHLQSFFPPRDEQIQEQRMQALARFRAETWLTEHSRAYAALRSWIGETRVNRFLQRGCRLFTPWIVERLPAPTGLQSGWEVNRADWYPEIVDAMESIVATVQDIRRSCESRGVGYMVYTMPLMEEAAPRTFEHSRTLQGIPRNVQYQMGKGMRYLNDRWRGLGIPEIPVFACMRAYPEPEKMYVPGDHHTTGEGDAVIARCIHEYLAQHYFPDHPLSRSAPIDPARVSK